MLQADCQLSCKLPCGKACLSPHPLSRPVLCRYLAHEKSIVSRYLRQHFGYYLLLLGVTDIALTNNSPVLIQIPVSLPSDFDQRGPLKKVNLISEYDALPFFPESIDVMVFAHGLSRLKLEKNGAGVLEVLKEAYKTLRHDGVLIITELNKFNFSAREIARKNKITLYSAGKIIKYLNQAGFDCIELERVSRGFNNSNRLKNFKIFQMGYVILAKKKTVGLTPLSLKTTERLPIRVSEPLLVSESLTELASELASELTPDREGI